MFTIKISLEDFVFPYIEYQALSFLERWSIKDPPSYIVLFNLRHLWLKDAIIIILSKTNLKKYKVKMYEIITIHIAGITNKKLI